MGEQEAAAPGGIPAGFGYTDEHGLLRDEARRFLEERCPIAEVRRLAEDPLGHDPGLWKELGELGWLGLTIPEAQGGAGFGRLHLGLLLEEMGRTLLPSPYLTHVLAADAIAGAASPAQAERWLPALASGDTLASLALCEPSLSWQPDAVEARAEAFEGGFVLRGRKVHVQDAESAGLLVVPARRGARTTASRSSPSSYRPRPSRWRTRSGSTPPGAPCAWTSTACGSHPRRGSRATGSRRYAPPSCAATRRSPPRWWGAPRPPSR